MSKSFVVVVLTGFAALAFGQVDFVEAANRMRPSLVMIVADKVEPRQSDNQSEPTLVEAPALGSGFVFDTLGHIVTCNHVIADYGKISVRFSDGTVVSGADVVVTGRDPVTDIAVIQAKGRRKFVPVRMGNSDDLQVGQPVLALGSPYGLEGSASAGIVSGLSRWGLAKPSGPDFQDYIQIDALVNPGNSGGPLVDLKGAVVGVSSFARTSRAGMTGIGFCMAGNVARDVAGQLIKNGYVIRGFLGISTQPVTEGIRRALDLPTRQCVLVSSVVPAGPGGLAGLRPGDAILALDGQPVEDVRWFQGEIAARAPGTAVKLGFVRMGARRDVAVALSMWPVVGTEPRPPLPVKAWLGLVVTDIRAAGGARAGEEHGVVVATVETGGPAARAGLRQGDFITEANLAPVRNLADFAKIERVMSGRPEPLLLRVFRGRQAFYAAVEP